MDERPGREGEHEHGGGDGVGMEEAVGSRHAVTIPWPFGRESP
jgi:hypothetical protein